MELTMDADIYEPNMDAFGSYVDYVPPASKFQHGLRCPCGSRKDHVFDCRSKFVTHIKAKSHQKWVYDLNMNKQNFYTECEKLKETVNNQKLIIARLEREVNTKLKTIDYLTQQLMCHESSPQEHEEMLSFD
ncbi:MAG: hypothetical protein ACOVRN_10420 [Flavobacterium sp.]